MSKHKINDVLYCVLGAYEAHNARNYGDEKGWMRHVYLALDKMLEEDEFSDLHEYGVVKEKR